LGGNSRNTIKTPLKVQRDA